MRSLVQLSARALPIPTSSPNSRITACTCDTTSQVLYLLAEDKSDATGSVNLQVLSVSGLEQRGVTSITSWITHVLDSPSSTDDSAIVSFKYLPESNALCLVLSNGDIEQLLGVGGLTEPTRETVGTFDAGIKAAEWSPDEELLALITGDNQLLSMTKDFEVLSEVPLRTDTFGADAPVNVGWGSKSSQFHGSVGKSAAQSSSTPSVDNLHASSDDDGRPRISWRGDSAFFSVSSLEASGEASSHRVIRVYTRVAELSSTAEPTEGLEHVLSWQPSGSIIASTQKRFNSTGQLDSHHVIFYERNGLRRYDFALRPEYGSVKCLTWNADSTILAVWLDRGGRDVVQMWHRNNYDWTIKQELSPRGQSSLNFLMWHPENALDLFMTTSDGIETFTLCWDVYASARAAPLDDGAVAVIDGGNIRLTPFRLVNIPPPMSALVLKSPHSQLTPSHLAFSRHSTHFAVLYPDGAYELWNWTLFLDSPRGKSRADIVEPVCQQAGIVGSGAADYHYTQCAVAHHDDNNIVAVLRSGFSGTDVVLIKGSEEQEVVRLPSEACRMVAGDVSFLCEAMDGTVFEVPFGATSEESLSPSEHLTLPERCLWIQHTSLPSSAKLVGLTASGRLYAGNQLLAANASSFCVTDDFLIYTTFNHEAKFVPLLAIQQDKLPITEFGIRTEALHRPTAREQPSAVKRSVERGSRIITAVPSATALVLQMPRGNLETICPRPLVLRIVRHQLDRLRYRAAFLACRRHRIDLNILYDHNPVAFQDSLAEFVTQVKDVDYLNLFLSGLKEEDVTVTMYSALSSTTESSSSAAPGKVNKVCDLLRAELEKRDILHYAKTILTAHVRKVPQDYESALRLLIRLKEKDAGEAEEAVKYVIFLSDANKLFDLALGMYDFTLVLMIAQHSQKDPREYLPFLRELKQLETPMQRYRIDDHLDRHDSALRNLALAGPDLFEDALAYTKRHDLFPTALEAYKSDPSKYKIIMSANAEHLFDHKKYHEAGLLYALSGNPSKAITAYVKANAWQELFALALSTESKRSASEIKALAIDVADNLRAKRRFAEAGRVLLEYARDVEAAIEALVEGQSLSEALRLAALYTRRDLIETHIKPGALEIQARILEDISEVTEQIEKQVERLAELKVKRNANPNQYYCLEDTSSAFENVELQPDGMSDAGTAFTRYTVAPTTQATSRATSQQSSRTTRSKRRAGLKKAAGKKGSIFEETYLLNSLKKSFEIKLQELQAEVGALLPVMLILGSTPLRTAAAALQQELTGLEHFLLDKSREVWDWREQEWEEEKKEEQNLRARGEWLEKPPPEEGTEKVERPKLAKTKWRVGLLDVDV